MKKILVVLLICFSGNALADNDSDYDAWMRATIPPEWVTVTELKFNNASPRQRIGPVFANSYTGKGISRGKWHVVDLAAAPWNVPADAKFAFLQGVLVITSGTTPSLNDLAVNIRRIGDDHVTCSPVDLVGQADASVVGMGARSNMATVVPLVSGRFEVCWTATSEGQWPDHASYGINLSVSGWAR